MFKKPEVNEDVYLTYTHIHKVALLGLLGAMLGYDGHEAHYRYNQQNKEKKEYPDFYDRLKDIKVSIVPNHEYGIINQKLQIFNNSVGYASKEEGGNLVVKEYWLEEPSWTIYLLSEDKQLFDTLADYLLNKKTVYTLYLGKNDHLANITDSRIIQVEKAQSVKSCQSLLDMEGVSFILPRKLKELFRFKEVAPVGFTPRPNRYIYKTMAFTNQRIKEISNPESYYRFNEETLYFY